MKFEFEFQQLLVHIVVYIYLGMTLHEMELG